MTESVDTQRKQETRVVIWDTRVFSFRWFSVVSASTLHATHKLLTLGEKIVLDLIFDYQSTTETRVSKNSTRVYSTC